MLLLVAVIPFALLALLPMAQRAMPLPAGAETGLASLACYAAPIGGLLMAASALGGHAPLQAGVSLLAGVVAFLYGRSTTPEQRAAGHLGRASLGLLAVMLASTMTGPAVITGIALAATAGVFPRLLGMLGDPIEPADHPDADDNDDPLALLPGPDRDTRPDTAGASTPVRMRLPAPANPTATPNPSHLLDDLFAGSPDSPAPVSPEPAASEPASEPEPAAARAAAQPAPSRPAVRADTFRRARRTDLLDQPQRMLPAPDSRPLPPLLGAGRFEPRRRRV